LSNGFKFELMAAGRPKKIINWDEVDYLLEADCEGTEIAAHLGMHRNVLYERCKTEKKCNFSEYLQEKKSKGNSLIKVKQFEAAVKDKDKTMLVWLGKQRLGQKDKQELDATNKNTIEYKNVSKQFPEK